MHEHDIRNTLLTKQGRAFQKWYGVPVILPRCDYLASCFAVSFIACFTATWALRAFVAGSVHVTVTVWATIQFNIHSYLVCLHL